MTWPVRWCSRLSRTATVEERAALLHVVIASRARATVPVQAEQGVLLRLPRTGHGMGATARGGCQPICTTLRACTGQASTQAGTDLPSFFIQSLHRSQRTATERMDFCAIVSDPAEGRPMDSSEMAP